MIILLLLLFHTVEIMQHIKWVWWGEKDIWCQELRWGRFCSGWKMKWNGWGGVLTNCKFAHPRIRCVKRKISILATPTHWGFGCAHLSNSSKFLAHRDRSAEKSFARIKQNFSIQNGCPKKTSNLFGVSNSKFKRIWDRKDMHKYCQF